MNVLVACEYSGKVRDAFAALGGKHYQGDVRQILGGDRTMTAGQPWDLMIAFPPCTHLASSGARWFKDKKREQIAALGFIRLLLAAPIRKIALENPIGVISTRIRKPDQIVQPWIRKPDQIVQPWMFGHGETKATCLWLVGLPKLEPTDVVEGREQRIWKMGPSPDRWKKRSETFTGIAHAMANQWGKVTNRMRSGSQTAGSGAS